MILANTGCSSAPPGSSMISRSEKRLTRNGSTAARISGPPRLKRTIAIWSLRGMESSNGAGKNRLAAVGRQVAVELHADRSHEQSSPCGDRKRFIGDLQEPVADRAGSGQEPLQLGTEVLVEVHAKPSLHVG